jgi:hypothetical protein
MPLRNRVSPLGEIIAVAGRGTLTGNRGVLHNAQRTIVRDWQVKRWIACRLEFRGRHREVMTPNRWTELFFLDEAAALADGHRPCSECRHQDYVAFQSAWRSVAMHRDRPANADAIDAVLHAERRIRPWLKRTHERDIRLLPDGTFIVEEKQAWLVLGQALLAWSAGGYMERKVRPSSGAMTVLTPPSVVGVLSAGYRPAIHPSATTLISA